MQDLPLHLQNLRETENIRPASRTHKNAPTMAIDELNAVERAGDRAWMNLPEDRQTNKPKWRRLRLRSDPPENSHDPQNQSRGVGRAPPLTRHPTQKSRNPDGREPGRLKSSSMERPASNRRGHVGKRVASGKPRAKGHRFDPLREHRTGAAG